MNLDRLNLKFAALETKPDGFIAGIASTPSIDSYLDIVEPGAFDASIAKRGFKGPRGIKMLSDHAAKVSNIIGVWTVAETRGRDLYVEGLINLKSPLGAEAYRVAKDSGLGFSVGFETLRYTIDAKTNVRTIIEADLREISAVVFPANEDCGTLAVKSAPATFETLAQLERYIVEKGLTASREKARQIVLAMKGNSHLLAKTGASQEDAAGQSDRPVEAATPQPAIDLAEVKAAFAKTIKALEAGTGRTSNA